MNERQIGRVRLWKDEAGWGFVSQDHGPDLFLHHSHIQGAKWPDAGDYCSFEIGENARGPLAINVRLIPAPGGDMGKNH